ncbi:sigma-E factor negative regulatory protein [Pseudomonas sp. MAP12]|uniref:Sigma-E factor negative regulatory protein n=1 Tax=Geopseudomonas aromaticivorans TaxID=2849492 RepID=A0ABS6N1N0_9GAMM|nr:sigma-E factor negative regulatory protein [Pseudomonas aromaticivorans]MBV2134715.1 sigma-E factor negative regulatory protein [Pseudomonas aromaticivorans]
MSREVLGESVSAVMDGEADELELRRVLAATGEDPEVRARWGRYQLARSVMHKQTVMPGLDLAAAVSAAIAAEAAPAPAPVVQAKSLWQQVGRLAVAASVTLAVLAGVRFYNSQDDAAGMAPQLAQQAQPAAPVQPLLPVVSAPQGPAVLASFPAPAGEEQAQQPAVDEAQILREVPRKVEAAPVDQPGSR